MQGELSAEDYSPGEKQCKFCPVKGDCEALEKFALSSIIEDFPDLTSAETLSVQIKETIAAIPAASAERLSIVLKNLDLIKQWVTAVGDHAYAQLLAGETIPGYKLVEGRQGSRQWTDEKLAESTMQSMRLKKDEMYSFSVISPTTAEKLLKDSVRKWNRLQPLITRKDAKPTIAPESDKRPALIISPVDDFEDLTADDLI
jgi:hypothetical protein